MQRLSELCSIVIQNCLGELAAQIFTALARHGRATLATLRSLTRLPFSRLHSGLAVLIQHHVVLHSSADDYEPTHFQVDWHSAYVLLRTEKIQRLVEVRHGETAGRIIDHVFQLGLVSVGDLAEEYNLFTSERDRAMDARDGARVNGAADNGTRKSSVANDDDDDDDDVMTIDLLHENLGNLLQHGFLVKVGTRSFLPQMDLQQHIQDTVIETQFPDGKVSGPKKQNEFRSALNSLKRKWQGQDEFSVSRDATSRSSAKRAKTSVSRGRGVQTSSLPNGMQHRPLTGDNQTIPKLPDDMIVRVNYNKCIIALRSQRLEHAAGRYLGPVTGAVYGALLRVLETKQRSSRDVFKIERHEIDNGEDDTDDDKDHDEEKLASLPSALDAEVLNHLDPSIDLISTIHGAGRIHKLANGVKDNARASADVEDSIALEIKTENGAGSDEEPENGLRVQKEHNKRLTYIQMHMALLAEHPKRFCIRRPGVRETRVDIGALTTTLVQSEIDTMIGARHGQIATRIVRIMRQYGKLEEKQISNLCLKRLKDVRQVLANLQATTLVDVQELPKEATRQPNRNTYLWFFDEARVKDLYLQHTYQGMSRMFQRIYLERDRTYRNVIEKAERLDVKGREDELLTKNERDMLREWRETEERMLIQIFRMDDVVALLRDFNEKDTSLDA